MLQKVSVANFIIIEIDKYNAMYIEIKRVFKKERGFQEMKKVFKDFMKRGLILFSSFLLIMHATIFTAYAIEDTNEDLIDSGEYVEINDDLLEIASKEDSSTYVTDLSEIYGKSITSLLNKSYEEIIRCILALQYGIGDITEINLGKQIALFDANQTNTYVGYNFYINNTEYGYITIATHTKTTFVKEIAENELLPEDNEKMYYLSSSEFYFWNESEQCFQTLENIKIPYEEFQGFLNERKQLLYNLTIELLASTEVNTLSQINNLLYLNESGIEELFLGKKKYSGQDGYGYGGIYDCMEYLKNRYGGTITLKSSRSLSMKSFLMSDLEVGANNCTLTAITRILYYYKQKGYYKIDSNYNDIYTKVRKVAVKYGYSPDDGTGFTKINNIVEEVLDGYGYKKGKCKEYIYGRLRNR